MCMTKRGQLAYMLHPVDGNITNIWFYFWMLIFILCMIIYILCGDVNEMFSVLNNFPGVIAR